MGRYVRANFRSRKSLARFLKQLNSMPPIEWPPQLNRAWIILHKEMSLPHTEALSVIFASVSAAHLYLQAESAQVRQIQEFGARAKVTKFFFRIARCASRAPVAVRARLDARIMPLVKEAIIDLEAIESIFDAIRVTFEEFPDFKASRAAITTIDGMNRTDFSMIRMTFRKKLEEAIHELANMVVNKNTVTVSLLNILAASLAEVKSSRFSAQSHSLITKYVEDVARIWRHAKLMPTRARSCEDCAYTSRFHRYVELLLEGLADSEEDHFKPPPNGSRNNREINRMHYHWYVSDDHVRAALGA